MQDLEHAIRERAYHLWMAEGCPDGNAETHWLVAQREILAFSLDGLGNVLPAAAKPKKAAKKATKARAA